MTASNFRERPNWHRYVLWASFLHSGIWGLFILALPARASLVYGFAEVPTDLHLWKGTGLFITLLAAGYAMAAKNPRQHWGIVAIALAAKVFGAFGMTFSAMVGDVSTDVLWLIPMNDIIWWWPFWKIVTFRDTVPHSLDPSANRQTN